MLGFIRDVFSFHRVRYVTLDTMKTDILKVAQKRIERVRETNRNSEMNDLCVYVNTRYTNEFYIEHCVRKDSSYITPKA